MRKLNVARLFEDNRDRLRLQWLCGTGETLIVADQIGLSPADLVGHLNTIHTRRMQVIGVPEILWAESVSPRKVDDIIDTLFEARAPAFIVADGADPPAAIRAGCAKHGVPLMTTQRSAASVIDQLRAYLARELADQTTLHGVSMDVLGMGVLITGDSGVGKSELALELISRGHGLVADDCVEISRIAPTVLEGRCPELLKDFLEVRGLGVLNIRTVFGETACRRKMKLQLVVHLQKQVTGLPEATRMPLDNEVMDILGVRIRKVVIPVAAGRNLAVLVEAAVRTTILHFRGIDSTLEFVERQRRAIGGEDT
ncbi:MAG: HPr(Ser) kinase/phosphatase [Gammaproteobacteria bacterium]|jgi:HPr kinase/phosphorylase|nr:HPr(Ser) kinase/phosphatase [Gammaproteobacteria bacterium]MBU0770303.1 HPr(Ser) kinase/phosphatase [Gammaproteobacteria bacterium]MBU0857245.1 HPr(Ser) kinase/phosphatase [Gammaproteobacteria bacterium]MBU1847920.1 HPr(Ser) kinase/phosphatase [Gammaproteobacteria bacterium]